MLLRYCEPSDGVLCEATLMDASQVEDVLGLVASHPTPHGIGAVEIVRDDGSVLGVFQTRCGFVLSWLTPDGSSKHTYGEIASDGLVTFDYFGSYSEVPASYVITRSAAVKIISLFVSTGTPDVPLVRWESD